MPKPTFARKPFVQLGAGSTYNASRIDQLFVNVEQAIPPQRVRIVTSNYTATTDDQTIAVNATTAPITITLPTPSRVAAFVVSVVKIDASGHAVTIGATVSGVSNPTLATQYKSKTMQSTGTEYITLASV